MKVYLLNNSVLTQKYHYYGSNLLITPCYNNNELRLYILYCLPKLKLYIKIDFTSQKYQNSTIKINGKTRKMNEIEKKVLKTWNFTTFITIQQGNLLTAFLNIFDNFIDVCLDHLLSFK